MRDRHYLYAGILTLLVAGLLVFLWITVDAAEQDNAKSQTQIANESYNDTYGAEQVTILAQIATTPSTTNALSLSQIANKKYNATYGANQVVLSTSTGLQVPFINTTSLTDGDLLYYDSTGEEWLNTQGKISVDGTHLDIDASNDIRIYGSSSQTTNPRYLQLSSDDSYSLVNSIGTPNGLPLRLQTTFSIANQAAKTYIELKRTGTPFFSLYTDPTTTTGIFTQFNFTSSASSGNVSFVDVNPAANQSGTAGFTALRVSPYLQGVGSGTKRLLDIGTNSAASGGGTHTSIFNVNTDGVITTNSLSRYCTDEEVADDGTITDLASINSSGWGIVTAGDNAEYCPFRFTAAGVVTLLTDASANCANSSSDGDICIYSSGSNGVTIENKLGDASTIKVDISY